MMNLNNGDTVEFKYLHDGGPHKALFYAKQVAIDGRRGVFIHVGDLTDHFRLLSHIDTEIIPAYSKNKTEA